MKSASVAVALFASLVLAACDKDTAPTTPLIPPTVHLASGDIVFRRNAVNGQTQLTLFLGTGPSASNLLFQCELFYQPASGQWPCNDGPTLNALVDYWIYAFGDPSTTPGLLDGEFWIKGQRVSRTVGVSQLLARPPTTYTAAVFRIIDDKGTIQ